MRQLDDDRCVLDKEEKATKGDIEASFKEINTYFGLPKMETKVVSVSLSYWGLWESLIGILCCSLQEVKARPQHGWLH